MSDQTVFVSSVMAGMTAERQAARSGVEDLGGRVSMFERLGGRDDDAETAYVAGGICPVAASRIDRWRPGVLPTV